MQTSRMEIFGARPEEPSVACLGEIERCVLFVGLYAHRYGFVPDGSPASITETEIRHAHQIGKQILCFVVDENHPWPPKMIEGEPGKAKLAQFKEWLGRTFVLDIFTTPGDLATKVVSSISRQSHSSAPSASARNATVDRIGSVFPSHHRTLHGRSQQVGEALRLISAESPYTGVAIQAIGGMGKTALARECCIAGEIWNTYEFVLGAQARKRQMRVDPSASKNRTIRFEEMGTLLRPRDFLVTVAEQLHLRSPASRTEADLETDIIRFLSGRSALFLLDNLETMDNMIDVLAVLERIGSPSRKSLITTREFPDEHSAGLTVYPLWSIQDKDACRQLVIERVRRFTNTIPERAVEAIVDVGHGHPLALELLSGKLVVQGPASILALHTEWQSNSDSTPNDGFAKALCDYVFDQQFRGYIGGTGADLLEVIALEDTGVEEDALRRAAGLADDIFDGTLSKLFEAGCIRREIQGGISILTMHSITQAHFRPAAQI
jgi:hypothetical protein